MYYILIHICLQLCKIYLCCYLKVAFWQISPCTPEKSTLNVFFSSMAKAISIFQAVIETLYACIEHMFGSFSRHFAQVRKMRFLPFSPLTPMQSVLLFSNQSPDSPFQVHNKPLKVTKIATFQVVILSFPSYLRIGNIKNSGTVEL